MRRVLVASAVSLVAAVPAQAQSDGLAGILLRFFSPANPVILRAAPDPFSHAAHFVSQPQAQSVLRGLNQGIATQLSTFPLGSSSPGFTFTFDPELGVFNRSAESFGPVFSERPLTAGKGKFSFGVSYLNATYDRYEGQELRDGDIQLYLRHIDVNGDQTQFEPWFEGDVIRADLFLDLEQQTTVLFANYGVSDRLDLGIAIPFQKVDLSARIHTDIEHLATAPDPFVVHAFGDGLDEHDFTESGSASGIGDIVLRGKYNFLRKPGGALAAALDLRLPTGDENDLLGSGATQAKLYLVASGAAKRFSPRATLGYTLSSGSTDFAGDLPDEINYSAGLDAALHPRLTLTTDVIGRRLRDTSRLIEQQRTFTFHARTSPAPLTETRAEATTQAGSLNLWIGAAGLKFNPAGRLLINASVLFSIGDSGLQDKLTPVFGIDYSF